MNVDAIARRIATELEPLIADRLGEILTGEAAAVKPREPIVVGDLTVDPDSREVYYDGETLPTLPKRQFELLALMASQPQRVWKKNELLRAVWGPEWVNTTTRTMDSHIYRLRHRLAEAGYDGMVNLWGIGYRLAAEVPDAAA